MSTEAVSTEAVSTEAVSAEARSVDDGGSRRVHGAVCRHPAGEPSPE